MSFLRCYSRVWNQKEGAEATGRWVLLFTLLDGFIQKIRNAVDFLPFMRFEICQRALLTPAYDYTLLSQEPTFLLAFTAILDQINFPLSITCACEMNFFFSSLFSRFEWSWSQDRREWFVIRSKHALSWWRSRVLFPPVFLCPPELFSVESEY